MMFNIVYTYYDTALRRQFWGSLTSATDPRRSVDAMQKLRHAVQVFPDMEVPHVVSVIEIGDPNYVRTPLGA